MRQLLDREQRVIGSDSEGGTAVEEEDLKYYQRGRPWRKKRGKTPEEFMEETDAAYDAMTPAAREKYYLHPSIWQRVVRFWRP